MFSVSLTMDHDLWDDDLPEGFIQEFEEIESQATTSQVPQYHSIQPRPSRPFANVSFSRHGSAVHPPSGLDRLQNSPITNSPSPESCNSGHQNTCFSGFSATQRPAFTQTGSTSGPLTIDQRKLKNPVKSMPTISSHSRNPSSAQIDWLRSQLDKEKSKISQLESEKKVLHGENDVLRDRYNCSINDSLRNIQKIEEESEKKLNVVKDENKELKKQLDNLKMQLLMKTKEAVANMDKHKELRNVSVLEPEASVSSSQRTRSQHSRRGWRPPPKIDPNVIEILSDDEKDQQDLMQFLALRGRNRNQVPKIRELPPQPSSSTTDVQLTEEVQTDPRLRRESSTIKALWRLQRKSPWIGSGGLPEGEFSVDYGQLLASRVGDKLSHHAAQEIGVIVTPVIDYDPRSVLKMDSSDLMYLKNLDRGQSVWGVNLKTMFSNSPSEGEEEVADCNQALETIKTLLGSQVSHYREESCDADMLPTCNRQFKIEPLPGRDPVMLPTLEPVQTHINALLKLSSWRQAQDMIRTIVLHVTGMINELYLRLCEPNIPNQLKDEFHKNEEDISRLYMEGPYTVGNTLHHEKWTKKERFVELRRGLALLALISCLDRNTANLLLQPSLLEEVSNSGSIPSAKAEVSYEETWVNARNRADVASKLQKLSNQFREKRPTRIVPQRTPSKSKRVVDDNWILSHVSSLVVTPESNKDDEIVDSGSASTVDMEEYMDVDSPEENCNQRNSISRTIGNQDSFKIWYDFYADSSKKAPKLHQLKDDKLQKLTRLVDPSLDEKEKRQLGHYLQRSNRFQEFFKVVAEEGKKWVPSDQGEGLSSSAVKNLFDYENRVSSLDSTICTQELNRMKPCDESDLMKAALEMDVDEEPTPQSSETGSEQLKNFEKTDSASGKESSLSGKDVQEKGASFFDRLKSMKGFRMPSRTTFDRVPTLKDGAEEEFIKVLSSCNNSIMPPPKMVGRKILAPLKKPLKRSAGPSSSGLNDFQEEVQHDIEKLFEKDNRNVKPFKKSKNDGSSHQLLKSYLYPHVLPINAPNFVEHFVGLYKKVEIIAGKLRMKDKLKPFKSSVFVNMLQINLKKDQPLPRRALEFPGSSSAQPTIRNEVEKAHDAEEDGYNDDVLDMLTQEAKKYNLEEHLKSYEEKKGKLHILEGLLDIVTCINYCRLTLTFYPLLASIVELIESLFMHSFHNNHFTIESLKLLIRILNEVVCCQPPPEVISKILSIMMYASVFPEIVDCLCRKRTPLVSLVSGNEFCFFRGVCMMQPLCFLAGLEGQAGRGNWSVGTALVRWLRLLHGSFSSRLAHWYNGNCHCIPVQNAALFSILAAASARYADQGTSFTQEQRQAIETTLKDGIMLCRTLIAVDPEFTAHVPDFDLYSKFIHSVRQFHDDPLFSTFRLSQYELAIIDYLIKAEKRSLNLFEENSTTSSRSVTPPASADFKDIFEEDHIFLTREKRYCTNLR